MSPEGEQILLHLNVVACERSKRRDDAALDARVHAIKHYQHARFERTYADLLAQTRYARAARFFLEDLYGPYDFSERDDQFARIVPALVRLFPHELVSTVRSLAELHALSETLDSRMAQALEPPVPDARSYLRCWQICSTPSERERQIALMLGVGRALDRYTRNPLLRHSLRLMRAPARAAGLGALQQFLETGFDTFKEMRGADEFLSTIATRERTLSAHLFGFNLPLAAEASASALPAELP